ncbi:MAG TPA: choice-of-anchor D domain-containing protein [Candidatus Kapabacteria bacterium]|nr:choice-of-anchor D domain-containing protein [Candidatus Kapabacteria bacterium]
MKKSSIWLRFFCIAFLLFFSVNGFFLPEAAHAQKGQTSLGTDFWLGFMPNSFGTTCCPPQGMEIFIGSGTANLVKVDIYGGQALPVHQQQVMTANTIWTLSSPEPSPWETPVPEQAAPWAVHVYSQNPVVVYGYQYTGANTSSTDSYLALPTPALGTDYFPSCYYDDQYTLGPSNPLAGQFLIISPFDDNIVTIGPVKTDTRAEPYPQSSSDVTILHNKGDVWNVTLAKGQTYLVQSSGLNYGDDDLTGTHIVSTKPIALISGHQLCSIPIGELASVNGSKDEVMEMIPPRQAWGSRYFDYPTATRVDCGDMVRVIAGEDNEQITATSMNGSPSALLLHAGDFYDFDLVTDPTVFSSDGNKPFLAVQMAYSQGYNGDPGLSDPFSIVLTPQQQFQKKMIFNTPDRTGVPGFVHYATFLCQTDSIQKIQINGHPIGYFTPAGTAPIPGTNPPMSGYRIILPGDGSTYLATCGAPFGCYLYGWSTFESYGHPAGMALGVPSPDTLPPLETHTSSCGNYQVELFETRHIPKFSFEDTRIADIAMITDTLDVRWAQPSYNYAFSFDPAHPPFQTGDSTAFFDLTVLNPAQDAYAAVWTTDRAGNDTVYQYSYTAPKVKASPLPFTFVPVRVTLDSCENIFFKNTETGSLQISSDSIMGIDTAGKFTISPSTINKLLAPGDSVEFQLCFSPSDTLLSSDTLLLGVGCAQFKYPLAGLGITPLIVASDVNFGSVPVGNSSLPTPVKIQNVGKAPLTITTSSQLKDLTNLNFTFTDMGLLPITLKPGEVKSLNFTFHPVATGPIQSREDWGTDLPAPFAHQIKDTSQLLGYGVQAGLNWDRPTQGYWTECSNPVIDTVNLINPSSGGSGENITVDTVKIIGQDADEFTIVGNGTGTPTPPQSSWNLLKNGTIPVYLQFTPKLAKGYILRSAQIIAVGTSGDKTFTPSIALTATVRHATIRITPSTYDFGTVAPGTNVSTNFWIHNDGDTVLSLSSLTVGNGFTLTGFNPGEQVMPGDSVMVTVNDVAQIGTTIATLSASTNVDTLCTPGTSAPLKIQSTSFIVAATGHDFGDVYVCQNGSAVVTARDSGSKDALLISVRIVDTLGSKGSSQFTFAKGSPGYSDSVTLVPGMTLHTGDSANFTVNFNPAIGGGTFTYVAYTFVDKETLKDTVVYQLLQGKPLHYTNTLSVQNGAPTTVYSAYPAQTIDVPVQMLNNSLDATAGVYGIQFTLRYKRDMFVSYGVVDGNLNPVTSDTMTDPNDPSYILNTVTITSISPITLDDSTIAHLKLEYVLSKDSVSDIEVMNPVYLDQTGAAVCWVSHDTVPSKFAGLDRCGDPTLHTLLAGGVVSFHIQQITPNPVSSHATVGYNVQLSGVPLTMEVYTILGQKEETVMNEQPVADGDHTVTFETSQLPSGQYVLRMTDGSSVESRPFVIEK